MSSEIRVVFKHQQKPSLYTVFVYSQDGTVSGTTRRLSTRRKNEKEITGSVSCSPSENIHRINQETVLQNEKETL